MPEPPIESPADLSSRLGSAVRQAIRSYNWPCMEAEKGRDYRLRCHLGGGVSYRTQIIGYPELGIAKLYVFVTDAMYKRERQSFVRELVERLNEVIVFGTFMYEADSGAVIYRDACSWQSVPTSEGVVDMLNHAAIPLKLWLVSYGCVEMSKATPFSAFTLAVTMEGCDEIAAMTHQTRSELLAVVQGGAKDDASGGDKANLKLL